MIEDCFEIIEYCRLLHKLVYTKRSPTDWFIDQKKIMNEWVNVEQLFCVWSIWNGSKGFFCLQIWSWGSKKTSWLNFLWLSIKCLHYCFRISTTPRVDTRCSLRRWQSPSTTPFLSFQANFRITLKGSYICVYIFITTS